VGHERGSVRDTRLCRDGSRVRGLESAHVSGSGVGACGVVSGSVGPWVAGPGGTSFKYFFNIFTIFYRLDEFLRTYYK
jgi:hypothetical protein